MNMQANFTAGMDSVAISNIVMGIDNSILNGQVSVKQFAKPAVRFELALDTLNADSYMPPMPENAEAVEVASSTESAATAEEVDIELPIEMLKELDVQGTFKLAAMQAMNLKFNNFETSLNIQSGVIALNPINIDMYQGQFRGQAGLGCNEIGAELQCKI